MAVDGEAVIRRFYELSRAGDPACWELWDEDAVATPPPEFPEAEEWKGRDAIRHGFASLNPAFGRWWEDLSLDDVAWLPDGRLLAEVTFRVAGERSGAKVNKPAAAVYTLSDGKIIRAEHFMDRSEARAVAGRMSNLDHIRSYYEALNSGDVDRIAEHFTEHAVHYYTRLGPHRGREIAENAKWGVETLDGRWWLEHGIEAGDEAVIEWTMTWRDPKSGEKRLNRGTEWFRFRDGKIAEVRAYHHGDRKNPRGDLVGFDHAGRGHTTLEDWRPPSR